MPQLIASHQLSAIYTAYEIEAPDIAAAARPGQVVLLRPHDLEAPVPCAIADYDVEKGTVTVVGRTYGPLDTGGTSIELTGPLGRPTVLGKTGKILCVAEGLGVAALLPRLRQFKEKGWYTQVIAGYPSKDSVFWAKRLDEFSDELYVVTEDGSHGIKGPIRHTIRAVCDQTADLDRVLAVGPLGLLKTTADITRKHEIPTWISLSAVFDGDGVSTTADSTVPAAADSTADPLADSVAAPVMGGNGPLPEFDWSEAADLNGHEQDFDELTEKLSIRISK